MTGSRISRIVALSTLFIAGVQTASAQVAPVIVIAFDAPGPVPVGSWGIAAAALFIGLLAAYFLRSHKRAASRMLAIGTVGVAAMLAIQADRAEAVSIPTNLTASPTALTISGSGTYPFVNAAGRTILLRSVTLTNPGGYSIDTVNSTCSAPRSLVVGEVCTVVVVNNNG